MFLPLVRTGDEVADSATSKLERAYDDEEPKNQPASGQPTHRVYAVTNAEETEKRFWTEIGAAWALKDGDGLIAEADRSMNRAKGVEAVSPSMLTESKAAFGSILPGLESVPAACVALAYTRSVEGPKTGRISVGKGGDGLPMFTEVQSELRRTYF